MINVMVVRVNKKRPYVGDKNILETDFIYPTAIHAYRHVLNRLKKYYSNIRADNVVGLSANEVQVEAKAINRSGREVRLDFVFFRKLEDFNIALEDIKSVEGGGFDVK